MRLGEAIFLGLLAGAAAAIAWEIWGEVMREQAAASAVPVPADEPGTDSANLAGDVESWLRSEGY